MAIRITFDGNKNPEIPTFVLATKSGDKLGTVNNITDVVLTDSMSDALELSFRVHKTLDDTLCQLWDTIVDFKLLWCKEWDKWFSIEVKLSESGETVKDITAYSLGEYELSQILLFDIEINTEDDIARPEYVAPTVLYDISHPECSLLHRLLSKAPHYSIDHVDTSITNLQRTFSFNGTSIKDAFDDVAEELGCLFVYEADGSNGQLHRSISVYDLEQTCLSCGYRGEFTGNCPECGSDNIQEGYGEDTAIFVSTDNLTDEITYETDAGSVKNCFRLTAGDELMTATIRACNPAGGSYIWYLPDDLRLDMSDELRSALASYDSMNSTYMNSKPYELDSSLVSQYNQLIQKYQPYNDRLSTITSPVIGYAELMRDYYDVIDFGMFLQTTMMPVIHPETKTAASQATLLTNTSLSPVAVSKLSDSTSKNTAESAIKTIVRALIDTARYSFTVNTTAWSNPLWTGTITVSSRTEDEHGDTDTATTGNLSLTFTDDYELYLRQVIDKKMKSMDTDDLSVSSVLSRSIEGMVELLPKYSYDCLSSMASCCQDVLNVIIDAGSGNQSSSLWDDIYTPYYNKLAAIQDEMNLRSQEIAIITDDATGGLQQNIEDIRSQVHVVLDLEAFLGSDLWLELCAYRREDEYSNSNFISDGLSNAEIIDNAMVFIGKAKKEIYKSATLQHSISATLSNLLTIEAFSPILDMFQVGNWIRVRVDDSVYRLRLLSYEVDFSSLERINVKFSDVTKTLDGTSDVSSVLQQASSMASTFGYVQRQANSGADSKNILANWVENGLATTQAKIIDSANNQNMVWDNHGMLFRRYDPIAEDYESEQLKIINSTIAITDDEWQSVKTAIGKFFYYDPTSNSYKSGYGINGETIVGKLILGEELGIYNTSGSLTFNKNGLSVSNTNNSVVINPNSTTLFKITKGVDNLLSVDSNGNLSVTGSVYASGGEIGGFQIDSTSIHTKNVAVTSNTQNSVALSSTDFTRTINSISRSGLRFAIGSKLGIANDGAIYASGATISGAITATSLTLSSGLTVGTVGSSTTGVSISSSGKLSASNAEIRGLITATSLSLTNGLSVGSYGTNSTGVSISSSGQLQASNATLRGSIYASGGTIGDFYIGSALYKGTSSLSSTTGGVYIGTDGIRLQDSYDTGTYVTIKDNELTMSRERGMMKSIYSYGGLSMYCKGGYTNSIVLESLTNDDKTRWSTDIKHNSITILKWNNAGTSGEPLIDIGLINSGKTGEINVSAVNEDNLTPKVCVFNKRNSVDLRTTTNAGLYHDSTYGGFAASDWVIYVDTSGVMHTNSPSDRRIKENITSIGANEALILLNNIEPVNYNYIKDENHLPQCGFIAQNVRDVLLENELGCKPFMLVHDCETGDDIYELDTPEEKVKYGLDYAKFVPILWKGWQILNERYNELNKKYNELLIK